MAKKEEEITVKKKVIEKGDKEGLLDAISEMLETFGFTDILLVASAGKGHPFASIIKATDSVKAVAVAGMGVKIVAEELDIRSDELAEIIKDKLSQAEDEYEKITKKEKKVRKIVVE